VRQAVLAVLAALLALACHRDPSAGAPAANPTALSDDELTAFTRWQIEYAALVTRHEAKEMQAHLDGCPLRGEKRELATAVIGGLFRIGPPGVGLVVGRDELRIGAARRRFGDKAVDAVLARESLVLAQVGGAGTIASSPAPPRPTSSGVPNKDELDAFVSGAGDVHLGMRERDVSAVLGRQPNRRQDATSPGATTDVLWDSLQGARPGAVLGHFLDGRLVRVEFGPLSPMLPRLDRATAESLTRGSFVSRAAAGMLRLADIEAVTRMPGYHARWILGRGAGGHTTVGNRWVWEVEPGGQALIVDEEDGRAGPPVIRTLR
jgi:hypothetical protein